MSIYVLTWIKEDLSKKGDDIKNYSLLELKPVMDIYKKKYCNRM